MKSGSVQIDGWLYFVTAVGVAFLTYISSEEAYKYIYPVALFWLKTIVGSSLSGANGLKAFRSMTYGRYIKQEQDKEDRKDAETAFVKRTDIQIKESGKI